MDEELKPQEIDGLIANGVNVFTSSRFGIALALKPVMTAGDVERWLRDVRLVDDAPMALLRLQLLRGAIRAGIIVHSTDKFDQVSLLDDAIKAQWYGAQLWKVYLACTTIDPN